MGEGEESRFCACGILRTTCQIVWRLLGGPDVSSQACGVLHGGRRASQPPTNSSRVRLLYTGCKVGTRNFWAEGKWLKTCVSTVSHNQPNIRRAEGRDCIKITAVQGRRWATITPHYSEHWQNVQEETEKLSSSQTQSSHRLKITSVVA